MYHINKEITGSGENIALNNTARHYFKNFNILGNSVQEGTPSIDSEAPIKSVGDNINLYEKDKATESYYVNMSTGNQVASSVSDTSDYIPILKDENYSISFEYETLLDSGARPICLYNTEKTYLSGSTYSITNKKVTITPSENGYLRFSYDKNCTKIKVSKGTSTGPYSPYGQGSIGVYNVNKNFLNIDGGITSQGITTVLNEDGSLSVSGTSTSSYANLTDFILCNLPIDTYMFSIDTILGSNIILRFYNVNKTTLSSYYIGATTKSSKISLTGEEVYYRLLMPTANGTTYNFTTYLQLEKGETATEHIQHQSLTKALYTQQPFRAIGDVKDRFVKQNGVWHEEHDIPEIKLIGSDFVSYASVAEGNLFRTKSFSGYISNIDIDSNYFKGVEKASLRTNNTFYYNGPTETFDFVTYEYTSLSDFQAWVNSVELKVYPILATPKLIPCTPEQVEQLESIEKETYSYDEVTNIFSTDEVSPYFEVTAYQRISEEFKTRLKEGKITRGYLKVLATDTLPEIIINENNYLKDLKIEELRYVPEEGIIGGTVAKRVSGNFNNIDSSFDIQDREIEVYLGVELEDETTEYIKYGTYIVQRPEDDQVNDNTSFEALDYMIKFNQEYKDRITYPCTLKQLLDDIIDQAGVNSKVATFANSDFIVENNQFEQGSTLRDVLKAITQVAFNWSRIDADDNLVMDFEIREETDEELGTDDYFNFKKSDDYGPVNVVVLRNSQVEGENVTIKDDKLINEPIGYNLFNFSTITRSENLINNNDGTFSSKNSKNNVIINCAANSVPYDDFSLPLGEYYIYMKIKTTLAVTLTNFFICTQNNNDVSQNIQKPLNITLPVNTETIIKTNVTLSEDKPKVGFVAYFDAITDFTVSDIMVSKSKEEKPYQPYIPIGEIEYVISDNPFAYTEFKRKQLIEAGKRLFGFKYTPMNVDMLGLMYLNSKDRISVENLNGQKYNTYLFDHTIDYTGIVLDSMESKAKTKTETKYQYVSSLAQGLSHVEIKVDKANKRIESIIESQEDVSEKVAKTVARIEVVYALSDSPTTAPTDGWSTTAPEWTAGKYMWQKTITTYANGTTAETAATNISGAKGEAGENGIGITQTNITYQKSTSGTTVPTGTWQTTIPEVDEDGYLWTRTEFIYSDGSKKYAYNVGKKGATGIGVKSIIDQYYSSTSSTELAGGEWKETQDTLQTDRFIWTRSKITWTNESVTYTDPILANTLNDINSNIIVFKEFTTTQIIENGKITDRVQETTKRLNNDYSTTEQVDSKVDKVKEDVAILAQKFVDVERTAEEYVIKINEIDNNGVDKIKTRMGYTFNDEGLKIDRPGADTSTIIDEAKIKVTDKTGSEPKSLLYAGYVKEGDTEFSDYEGQTIVATSNLIVQNFLIIGSNSRFQDYYNETLGGNGTGAFDI